MANKEKGGGQNLTRQHYQIATGNKAVVAPKGGKVSNFSRGAKVAPKRGRG